MRLFFALWPDDSLRQQISDITKQAGSLHHGKAMHADNLHLTLVFLGTVSQAQYDCVVERAGQISVAPFDLCLDHIGWFQRARVLWLGLRETPDALLQLASALQQQAMDCGITPETTTFTPHVTLMRKVSSLHDMKFEPIHWEVNGFCLVQSHAVQEGVEYRVVKRWH